MESGEIMKVLTQHFQKLKKILKLTTFETHHDLFENSPLLEISVEFCQNSPTSNLTVLKFYYEIHHCGESRDHF
jgi:hypothetical protein